MKKILSLVAAAMVCAAMTAEEEELKLYSTNFQEWDAVASSTTVTKKEVTTRYSNEQLVFSFAETEIKPDGTNSKFTGDAITVGYAMAAKTATPYIETSVLRSVTKVIYVHAATGGSRGWGLQVKGDGDADWVTANDQYCQQAGTEVEVEINRTNVQLRWYNLNASQNAYMTEFAIYGMAEDDGQAVEYTISYYDQNGKHLGDSVQTDEQTLGFKYTEADLTIPEGYKFRGWYDGGKIRHEEGEPIIADLRLNAMVTKIEEANEGSFYVYPVSASTFYYEDHELIDLQDGTIVLTLSGGKSVVVVKKGGQETTEQLDGETETRIAAAGVDQIGVYFVKDFVTKDEKTGYISLASGDAASLILTVKSLKEGDKVFLPNGIYDLGEIVLTTIAVNNVSIIGQSMEGTIIRNAPDAATESIDKTATIKINKNVSGTYLQDLTIQNALDYYKANNGRAVALWDQGTQTVCKNVRLLSYQDTYYSNLQGAVRYFEDCEIHGTVDFICGDGSVYFKNNLLYCEKRNATGGGSDALTANNGPATDRGYVFESCTVKSECPSVSLGRAWNNTPSVAYLNTLVDYSAGEFNFLSSRWTKELMNANAWPKFGEYNTHLADGTVLTPTSNQVTFVDQKSNNATQTLETVLTADEAAVFTMAYTLGDWAETAANEAKQAECEKEAAQFDPEGIYLVEADGAFEAIIKGGEFMDKFALYNGVNYTVRKANARGGFGPRAGEEQGVESVQPSENGIQKIIRDGQVIIIRDNKQYNVLGAQQR